MSVAYIADRKNFKNELHLNLKKKFKETYQENKKKMDQNKEEFFD